MDKSAGHWCSFLPNWSWAQADLGELQQIFSSPVQVGLRLAVKKKNRLYCEGGESLAQVAQGTCGCTIPGSV